MADQNTEAPVEDVEQTDEQRVPDAGGNEGAEQREQDGKAGNPEDEPAGEDTFPRSYVEALRRESQGYRTRAQDRDALALRLHRALVASGGRLADPSDLEFDEGHLDDAEKLDAAIDDLLARKPHLASRRPRGDVGQGAAGAGGSVDLAGLLRSRAS